MLGRSNLRVIGGIWLLCLAGVVPPAVAADLKSEVKDDAQIVYDRPNFSAIPPGAADAFAADVDPTLDPVETVKVEKTDPALAIVPVEISLCRPGNGDGAPQKAIKKTLSAAGGKETAETLRRADRAQKKNGLRSAIAELEKGLSLEPTSSALRESLAELRIRSAEESAKKKQNDDAAREYRRALYVVPGQPKAESALDKLLQAAGKDPRNPDVRRRLAEDLEVIPDLESAIVEYRRCLAIKNEPADRVALGWCLRKHEAHREAFAELRQAKQAQWSADQARTQGNCHRYLGDILWDFAQQAKKQGRSSVYCKRAANAYCEYRNALLLFPEDEAAQAGLAAVCRAALSDNPTVDAWLANGGSALLCADYDIAGSAFREAGKLQPENPAVRRAVVFLTRSLALRDDAGRDEVSRGITEMQSALDADPRNAAAWYVLGRLREKQGDSASALDAYKQAEDLDPQVDPDLPAALARTRQKQ